MRQTQNGPYLVTDATINKIVSYLAIDEAAAAPFEPLGFMMHREEYMDCGTQDECEEILSNSWACERLAHALYELNRTALRDYLAEESDDYGELIIDYTTIPPAPADSAAAASN